MIFWTGLLDELFPQPEILFGNGSFQLKEDITLLDDLTERGY